MCSSDLLYEFMQVDETVRELVLDRAMAIDLRRHARKNQGMMTLREDGILKCAKGITGVPEVADHTDKYDD